VTQDGLGSEVIAQQAVKGSLYLGGASAITLALGLARSICLARLVMPEAFGVVALALFYIGMAFQLCAFGLDTALIHRRDAGEPLLRTYFTLRVGLDVLSLGMLAMLTPLLQRLYPNMIDLGRVLLVLIAGYLFSGLDQVQETRLRKSLAFRRIALVNLVASLVVTASSVYVAFLGWGIWALVVERVTGLVTRFILVWGPFRQWKPKVGWDKESARWLWEYGKPVWVASKLGYLLDHFDDFWVGTTLGKLSLGYYAKAYEFARYPRRIFANPLVSVLGPIFASIQHDRLRRSQLFYRAAYFILRTGFLIAGVVGLAMPEFIELVIGPKWMPMLWTFRLMMVYVALDAMVLLVNTVMLYLGRPDHMRNARLIQVLVFVPLVVLGSHLWGRNGVAVAADVMLLVGIWRLGRPLQELLDISFARLCIWPCIALIPAWAAGYWIEINIAGTSWMMLGLKVGTFSAIFILFLFLTERGDYVQATQWLWRTVQERRRGSA